MPCLVGPPLESGTDFLANHYHGRREVCWCTCAMRTRDVRELIELIPQGWVLGDMFCWTKLAFRGPVACVPRTLCHYILYRAENDNMSHGTPPTVWGRESRQMVEEIMQSAKQCGSTPEYLAAFKKNSTSHVARSVANQFVWARIRGASRAAALPWTVDCMPYLSLTWPVISRLGAALILPRGVLRKALMKGAAGLAANRQAPGQN